MAYSMRLPIPWFGYKGAVSDFVWAKFGDTPNAVYPFIGAGGVFFGRPGWHCGPRGTGVETVNDLHAELANTYRALLYAPDAVAAAADHPVCEVDITARWRWSKRRVREWPRGHGGLTLRQWLEADPWHCDPQLAGMFLWGSSATIGNAWDRTTEQKRAARSGRAGTTSVGDGRVGKSVALGGTNTMGRGVHSSAVDKRVVSATYLSGNHGTHHSMGQGINAGAIDGGRDGIHNYVRAGKHLSSSGLHTTRVDGDRLLSRRHNLIAYFRQLQDRMQRTRIMCGDFERALRPSVTTQHGLTSIFLDPEYDGHEDKYASKGEEQEGVFARCARRATEIVNADLGRGKIRLIMCGYHGDFDVPEPYTPSKGRYKGERLAWEEVAWKSSGYGERSEQGRENQARERMWCSPHCLAQVSMTRCIRKSAVRGRPESRGADALSVADPRQQPMF